MTDSTGRDRAVSEILGFVLVFSLITLTIGVVYATSFTGLHNAQQAESLENVERAFDVLADNFDDLYRREATSRATEMKLSDGRLQFGEPVEFEIYAENGSDPGHNATFSMTTEPIAYVDGDTEIVYVSGAVIRRQSGGSAMLSDPGWIVGPDQLLLPFIETYQDGPTAGISGGQTVLIAARRQAHGLEGTFDPTAPGGPDVFVNVTIRTEHTDAWREYMSSQGFTITAETSGSISGTKSVEDLYVPEVRVPVEIRA